MERTRRDLLIAGAAGSAALAGALFLSQTALAEDDPFAVVEQLTGRKATESDRLQLKLPPEFPTGYTVPMDIAVDSPMTEGDHVRYVRVFAPQNPIVEIARFNFVPGLTVARVSTRIRLAAPQFVVAVAELSDGSLLSAKTWVNVASNGCA